MFASACAVRMTAGGVGTDTEKSGVIVFSIVD